MSRSIRTSLCTFLVVALVFFGVTWWYKHLSLRQKQFIQNLWKQVPDLPARYMV